MGGNTLDKREATDPRGNKNNNNNSNSNKNMRDNNTKVNRGECKVQEQSGTYRTTRAAGS